MLIKLLVVCGALFSLTPVWSAELLLAKVWDDELDPADYWVSEKLDGVRAYWDGEQLWTRSGNKINAPAWYSNHFPKVELDGELWIGRGQFAAVSAAVRRSVSNDAEWRQIQYRIFELPNGKGDFSARITEMTRLTTEAGVPWLTPVKQFRLATIDQLQQKLNTITEAGGEGLMLHRADAQYTTGRSDALLKLKQYQDAEATVIGTLPGKGRLAGRMGSIEVKTADGRQFRIGSGFSDAERLNPPPIGSVITYRYNGLTAQGLPRFARYLK